MIEGVHFDLLTISARELGHKAFASCLSDLAAMNARPLYCLVSLALPRAWSRNELLAFVLDFYSGADSLLQSLRVDLVGGDLAASPHGLFVDVMCAGESSHPVTRSGARPGDWVAVSGTLGKSGAGFFALSKNLPLSPRLRSAHLQPRPRFDALASLQTPPGLVTSMIDISDGLASELHHLSRCSRVGFRIESLKIPLEPEAIALAQAHSQDALEWALSGGEDYELLVTLRSELLEREGLEAPAGFTRIGSVTSFDQGLALVGPDGRTSPLLSSGYNHFGMRVGT